MEINRGPKDKKRSHTPILEALLRLRIFCNVGLLQEGETIRSRAIEPDEMLSLVQLEGDLSCCLCGEEVDSFAEDGSDGKSRMTHCYRIVCRECVPSILNESRCPICRKEEDVDVLLNIDETCESVEKADSRSKQLWPSKMLAVAEDLTAHLSEEKRFVITRSLYKALLY